MPETPLRNLKGIGEKTEKRFEKMGLRTQEDLLRDYPRTYDVFEDPVSVSGAVPDRTQSVEGTVTKNPSCRSFGNNSITMAFVGDGQTEMQVNWFHMPYLRSRLRPGTPYVFRGPVIRKSNRLIMEHPQLFSPEEYEKVRGKMLPVYALTEGISNNLMRKTVKSILETHAPEKDYFSARFRGENRLPELNRARADIHFPENEASMLAARRRFVFEDFFFFLLESALRKEYAEQAENGFRMREVRGPEEVIRSLPYALTESQQKVWESIRRDLEGEHLMHRMIQGDVGSGKTILAFLAMIMTSGNQYQSALMVPTEVLAEQHYEALTKLLEKNGMDPSSAVLLTGSRTQKQKKEIYEKIASGEAKMVIGTHAVIQDKVAFRNLALAITDEQHRFGVRQRERLAQKGEMPHVLVMSATPIPRTLSMILYGDLDLSVLGELPAGRRKIKNAIVNTSFRPAAYRFLKKETDAGHQAYVICPLVEPSEGMEGESVAEYAEKLRVALGPEVRVGTLHGRMRPEQKADIMRRFAAGEIQILVSTTVVEVGVNVPNATVMMIENAERYGLSQLHQLRGRVGRGEAQSYCIFVQSGEDTKPSARLQILGKSNDGFYIAEQDLRLRGPGDRFGVRQSGMEMFPVADLYRDSAVLEEAGHAVQRLLEEDPQLKMPENVLLRESMGNRLYRQNDREFLGFS